MKSAWRKHGSSFGQPAKPEPIAVAMAFLASDHASYLNGAILLVDNSWLAG